MTVIAEPPVAPPIEAPSVTPPEPVLEPAAVRSVTPSVILKNVRWATYRSLREDLGDSSGQRVAYDQGTMEIRMPSTEHEETNRTIASLVEFVALEWELETRNLGSTTFQREDLARGFEPDTCFYIQSLGLVAGETDIDLTQDPAPDLVIEIDITSGSLEKLPLYARLGIPEVWRYQRDVVTLYLLNGEEYQEQEVSRALPLLTRQGINDLLAQSRALPRTRWVRAVQEWARTAATGAAPQTDAGAA